MFDDSDVLEVDAPSRVPEKSLNVEVHASHFHLISATATNCKCVAAIHRPKGLGSILERGLHYI